MNRDSSSRWLGIAIAVFAIPGSVFAAPRSASTFGSGNVEAAIRTVTNAPYPLGIIDTPGACRAEIGCLEAASVSRTAANAPNLIIEASNTSPTDLNDQRSDMAMCTDHGSISWNNSDYDSPNSLTWQQVGDDSYQFSGDISLPDIAYQDIFGSTRFLEPVGMIVNGSGHIVAYNAIKVTSSRDGLYAEGTVAGSALFRAGDDSGGFRVMVSPLTKTDEGYTLRTCEVEIERYGRRSPAPTSPVGGVPAVRPIRVWSPPQPINVRATPLSVDTVAIEWVMPYVHTLDYESDEEDGIAVIDWSSKIIVTWVPGGSPTAFLTGLAPAAQYCVSLSVFNIAGQSALTAPQCFLMPPA